MIRRIALFDQARLAPLLLCAALWGCSGDGNRVVVLPSPANPGPGPDGNSGDALGTVDLPLRAGSEAACTADPGAAFNELFSYNGIKAVRVLISQSEWDALLSDFDANNRNEVYRIADVLYGNDVSQATRISNVGFRLRGAAFSRERPFVDGRFRRVHLKLKFNERFDEDESVYGARNIAEIPANRGRLFRGVRSLNFKHNREDRSYLRELFVFDALYRLGLAAPRFTFARLYIRIGGGADIDFGVYHMSESLDSAWVRRSCGRNAFLFKCLYQDFGPADLAEEDKGGDIGPSTGVIGMEITDPVAPGEDNADFRPSYDLKTKDDEFLDAEAALNDLIRLLGANATKAELEAVLDIPVLLRVQALSVVVGKWDGYWRNGNNYYLLLNPNTGLWTFLPYDYDRAFDERFFNFHGAVRLSTQPFVDWGRDVFQDNDEMTPALMERVMAIPEFRQMYLGYVAELVDSDTGVFDPDNARARLTELSRYVQNHASGYDVDSESPFSANIEDIVSFIATRARIARAEIAAASAQGLSSAAGGERRAPEPHQETGTGSGSGGRPGLER